MRSFIFSICLIYCLTATAFGQNFDNTSLKKAEVKWLQKEGFPLSDYAGNLPEINHHLTQGLKLRKQSNTYAVIGGIGLGVGSFVFSVGVLGAILESAFSGNPKPYNGLLLAGGVIRASSIASFGIALGKGRKGRWHAGEATQKFQRN